MGHIRRKLEMFSSAISACTCARRSEADGARPKHFTTDLGLGYRFEHVA